MPTKKSFPLNKWLAPGLVLGAALFSLVLVVKADSNPSSTTVVVGNAAPAISVDFNAGNTITLNEGTYKWATATLTVTDANGCSTIKDVEARAIVSSSSPTATNSCAPNDNNCYPTSSSTAFVYGVPNYGGCVASTTSGHECTGGTDTSVDYDCGFKLWYIANATDGTAPVWATSQWSVVGTTSDGLSTTTAYNNSQTVEVNTLNALSVTGSISYGTLSANTDSGATNSTTTATTTGNTAVDTNVSGSNMTSGGNTLAVGQQYYKTSPFTYHTGATQLTTGATALELTNAYPTSTTSPEHSDISWGIGIPNGQANGTYTGTNQIDAIAD